MTIITVQSSILDAVAARVALMTVANGYTRNIKKIDRARLAPFSTEDLPALNYWLGADVQVAKGAGWIEREVALAIEYYTKTRDLAFVDVAYELAVDVAFAMARSPANPAVSDEPDFTMGGLVRSSQLQSITPQIAVGQAPWCGAALSYALIYRVSADNPTTLV